MADRRVVVVGSGPGGAAAAWQLVRRGIPVTMLESGLERPDGMLVRIGARNLFRDKPGGDFGSDSGKHKASGDPRTKWYFNLALGGLSNQWTGAVPRFAPEDFTDGARLHDKYVWPLSYAELTPYYERVEKLMGIVGCREDVTHMPAGYVQYEHRLPADWRAIARGAASLGHGITTLPLADGPPFLVKRGGTAFSSYTAIVEPLLSSPLFSLRCGAHALRLEWSSEKQRVTAIIYQDRSDGSQQRLEAAAFVIAAGAMNSTKLLLDSTCPDFPTGLGNSRDLLGRYLHDHPREWWVLETERRLSRLVPAAYVTRGNLERSPPLLATAWTLGTASMKDKLLSFTPVKGKCFGVQVFGTMIPTATHRVTSHPEQKDDFGLPILDISLEFDEPTLNNMVSARERLLEVLEAGGIHGKVQPVAPDQLIPGSSFHYGGTVRMHRSPEFGVSDPFCRIYDAPNVIAGDASCFTTGVEKNPTLTLMALSARACDRLASDLHANGPMTRNA